MTLKGRGAATGMSPDKADKRPNKSARKQATTRARKIKSLSARRKQVDALRTSTQKKRLKKRYRKTITVSRK